MKNCLKKIELLSPAGDMQCLVAAVNNGCDAVYLGGKSFSARNMASNFTEKELEAAIDYAHLRGVKVYITVNTIYMEHELNNLLNFCELVYRIGADAFIVQDLGAAKLLGERFDIALHASTQLAVRNAADAKFVKGLGFKRIILSREMPLEEIENISGAVETEVFIHGALCYSHSGRCLMSAFLGGRPSADGAGRSGNRGTCAQPCRLNYTLSMDGKKMREGYLISPRDMMGLEVLPEIISAGVSSLKIEGRLKSPQYVALATRVYRERIDKISGEYEKNVKLQEAYGSDEEMALIQVFSRGGAFCDGYFKNHSSCEMMSINTPKSTGTLIGEVVKFIPALKKCVIALSSKLVGGDGIEIYADEHVGAYYNSAVPASSGDRVTVSIRGVSEDVEKQPKPGDKVYKSYDKRLDDKLKKLASEEGRKLKIDAKLIAKIGESLFLTLKHGDITAEAVGGEVAAALKQPLAKERLVEQLSKTGGTPFEIDNLECDIDENIYVNIKSINEVRRQALENLENTIYTAYKRDAVRKEPVPFGWARRGGKPSRLTVLANTAEHAFGSLDFTPERIYLECTMLDDMEAIAAQAHEKGIKVFAALPSCAWPNDEELLRKIQKTGVDGYLVRTYGHIDLVRELGAVEIALDYCFNVVNPVAYKELVMLASSVCLSPELDASDITEACAEVVVYGRLTLMTSNLCPVGIYMNSKSAGKYCNMRGDGKVYELIDRKDAAFPVIRDCEACTAKILSCKPIRRRAACGYRRIDFTMESREECIDILSEYTLATENSFPK